MKSGSGAPVSGRRPGNHVLPGAYFLVSMLLVAIVLPTILRPSPDNPQTSTEFSPDAPPEEDPEQILSSFSRAQSGTAGAGTGIGPGEGGPGGVDGTGPPETTPGVPAACPRGIGGRQTESVYSAPCAGAWQGDNGGATYPGVSRTEVRVAVALPTATQQTSREGPVPTEPQAGESGADRTYRVFQEYFSSFFQLYGRQLRLIGMKPNGVGEATNRAKAQEAVTQYDAFAGVSNTLFFLDEMSRSGRVGMGGFQPPHEYYARHHPRLWSWNMDGTAVLRLAAEYACKKLEGRPPQYNEGRDLTFDYDAPRRFGLIYYDGDPWTRNGETILGLLRDECGLVPEVSVGYNLQSQDGQSMIPQAILQMRSANVTTIIHAGEILTISGFTAAADSNNYYPEWFIPGFGLLDDNQYGRTASQTQWRHAFGITGREMARPDPDTDWYRAYKAVEPQTQPAARATSEPLFYNLLQIVNGIQQTGPTLNPDNFARGLTTIPKRPNEPIWSIGGGFGPGKYTFPDDVAEIWWDPVASAPDGQTGAYRYVQNGKRYARGEIPREEPRVFEEGVTAPR